MHIFELAFTVCHKSNKYGFSGDNTRIFAHRWQESPGCLWHPLAVGFSCHLVGKYSDMVPSRFHYIQPPPSPQFNMTYKMTESGNCPLVSAFQMALAHNKVHRSLTDCLHVNNLPWASLIRQHPQDARSCIRRNIDNIFLKNSVGGVMVNVDKTWIIHTCLTVLYKTRT